jgi:hypothetical protein
MIDAPQWRRVRQLYSRQYVAVNDASAPGRRAERHGASSRPGPHRPILGNFADMALEVM